MKKILFGLALILGLAGKAHATNLAWPGSTYLTPTIVNSTVSFSSSTVTTLSANGFFEVVISSLPVTYFYRVDNVSTGVTTVGMPVAPGTVQTIVGYNAINFQIVNQSASQTPAYILTKPN